MNLKIGESKTFKLPIWLKAVDILCEGNGLRLERKGQNAVLNVNNGSRRTVYAGVPLGRIKELNEFGFKVKAHSKNRMLFSVGKVLFVIDYGSKKMATNLIGLRFYGSKEWGENVQIPWRGDFMPLFDLPVPPPVMDKTAAELFWRWFHSGESAIVTMMEKGKKEAKSVCQQINLWLCPIFPYLNTAKIEFELKCSDKGHSFTIHHSGDEQLGEDLVALGEMMPEGLGKMWKFTVEE